MCSILLPSLQTYVVQPTISLSLGIAHDFGAIWEMKWCPSGAYQSSVISEGQVRTLIFQFMVTNAAMVFNAFLLTYCLMFEPLFLVCITKPDAFSPALSRFPGRRYSSPAGPSRLCLFRRNHPYFPHTSSRKRPRHDTQAAR